MHDRVSLYVHRPCRRRI